MDDNDEKPRSLVDLFAKIYFDPLSPHSGFDEINGALWTIMRNADSPKDKGSLLNVVAKGFRRKMRHVDVTREDGVTRVLNYLDKAALLKLAAKIAFLSYYHVCFGFDPSNSNTIRLQFTTNSGDLLVRSYTLKDLMQIAHDIASDESLKSTSPARSNPSGEKKPVFEDAELFKSLFFKNVEEDTWHRVTRRVRDNWNVVINKLIGGVLAEDGHWYPSPWVKSYADVLLRSDHPTIKHSLGADNDHVAAQTLFEFLMNPNTKQVIFHGSAPELTELVMLQTLLPLETRGASTEIRLSDHLPTILLPRSYSEFGSTAKIIERHAIAISVIARAYHTDAFGNADKINAVFRFYSRYLSEHSASLGQWLIHLLT